MGIRHENSTTEPSLPLRSIFIFGLPGSRRSEIGSHVAALANSAINQTHSQDTAQAPCFGLTDLTAQNWQIPFHVQRGLQVDQVAALAAQPQPQIVVAGAEVLEGNYLLPTSEVREKIGQNGGLSFYLDVWPDECAASFAADERPPIFSGYDGYSVHHLAQSARGLAHESIMYGLRTPPAIIGEVVANVALYTSITSDLSDHPIHIISNYS